MDTLLWVIGVLVAVGTVLAVAESSMSRMTRARAMALRLEGRRRGALLERIQSDPPQYLNAIYLAVMVVQNGSAILVALWAEHRFGNLGMTIASVVFTLGYFVVVEAMAKTFGILHSDGAALALAPFVLSLGQILALPARGLIGLANLLLPGRGLSGGPFVSPEMIRTMAEVGAEEGSISDREQKLIHSVFMFGDTIVREIMVARPDMVAVAIDTPLSEVQDRLLESGYSRLPVFRESLDEIEGIVHAKEVLRMARRGRPDDDLGKITHPAHFVPESKRVADLLPEMQRQRLHMVMVTDEYGSVSGLVTLEDVLEELVGEIVDEHDREQPLIVQNEDGTYSVDGRTPVDALAEQLEVTLPEGEWDTAAGLMLGLLGAIPAAGEEVRTEELVLRADEVRGRRLVTLSVERLPEPDPSATDGESGNLVEVEEGED